MTNHNQRQQCLCQLYHHNKNKLNKNAIRGKTISTHFAHVLPHITTRCLSKSTEMPAFAAERD